MKFLNAGLSFLLMLMLSGCILKSLNQFYTNESRTTLPDIHGAWRLVPDNLDKQDATPVIWEFSEDEILTMDEKGVQSRLKAVYFKVGENIFVDLFPGELEAEKNKVANGYWIFCVEPLHTLLKVARDADSMKLIPPDLKKILQKCKDAKISLKFVKSESIDSTEIFVSSSEEWMKFLEEFGNDEEIFNERSVLRFRREITKGEGEQAK